MGDRLSGWPSNVPLHHHLSPPSPRPGLVSPSNGLYTPPPLRMSPFGNDQFLHHQNSPSVSPSFLPPYLTLGFPSSLPFLTPSLISLFLLFPIFTHETRKYKWLRGRELVSVSLVSYHCIHLPFTTYVTLSKWFNLLESWDFHMKNEGYYED